MPKLIVIVTGFVTSLYIWLRIALPFTLSESGDFLVITMPAVFVAGAIFNFYLGKYTYEVFANYAGWTSGSESDSVR